MLARFVDSEGKEHWLDVKVRDAIELREGGRRVSFVYRIDRVEVEEVEASRVERWLEIGREVLDKLLSEGNGRVSYNYAVLVLSDYLPSPAKAEDIISLLCSREYIEKDGEILCKKS